MRVMTVRDLIEQLQQCDPEAIVMHYNDCYTGYKQSAAVRWFDVKESDEYPVYVKCKRGEAGKHVVVID